MLSELKIERYRGIRNLELKDLGMVNIIAGANNTGKTSILEIIESLEAPDNLRAWRMIGRREGNSPRMVTTVYDTMKSLFPLDVHDSDMIISYSGVYNSNPFEIEIKGKSFETIVSDRQLDRLYAYKMSADLEEADNVNEYETGAIEIQYRINREACGEDIIYQVQRGLPNGQESNTRSVASNVVYISPTQHAQNFVFLDSLLTDPDIYEQFVDIMREFDSGFVSINSVAEERTWGRKYVVLSKNHREGLLLNAYGDGMKKAMLLLSAVLRAKDGILLLDEFETAIHNSAMENVFSWILNTAKKMNVQVFMTSHSIEAIETVLKCCPNIQDEMRMITLVNVEDVVKVRNVNAKKAIQLLDEYGMELR